MSPAQQHVYDLVRKEFGDSRIIEIGNPIDVVYAPGLIRIGDFTGGSDPYNKLYGYWVGKNIKRLSRECYHNVDIPPMFKAQSEGYVKDMMHHFIGKEGDFTTESFFFTDINIEFSGDYMKFVGFNVSLIPIQ